MQIMKEQENGGKIFKLSLLKLNRRRDEEKNYNPTVAVRGITETFKLF